jgi:ribosomal protein S27E
MSVRLNCPGCGGPITFKVGSAMVAVCPYCRSVVARGDRNPENLGKVADLVETDSILQVGLRGKYQGVRFELTGRTQLRHQMGGVWDEWYAAFADGRWGWLAEGQGRYYLTFQADVVPDLPSFDALNLGQILELGPSAPPMTVTEIGEALAISAQGEIPFRFEPDSTYGYADLSGGDSSFATLDYSEDVLLVFRGEELGLDDLGFPPNVRPREPKQIEGDQLACPQCAGPLDLRVPDQTQRVTCPNCGSLLDVNHGKLSFLSALATPIKPEIPLGSKGVWNNDEFTAIGFLRRGILNEGESFEWDEYLLYHPRKGFRWLTCSDRHWNFVEPLPPGTVEASESRAKHGGKRFRLFGKGTARVDRVLGEFYWKVAVGESVQAADFVRPPEMLSREVTMQVVADGEKRGIKGEINWSRGTYASAAEVEAAFNLTDLPRPALGNVGANQPFRFGFVYRIWAILSALTLAVWLIALLIAPRKTLFDQTLPLKAGASPENAYTYFSEPLELRGWKNIAVTAKAPVDNSWVDIEGDFINEESGLVQTFYVPVAYFHGVEDGESWSEGSGHETTYVSALPAGTYTLRLEFQAESGKMPPYAHILVRQGVPRIAHLAITLALIAILPLVVLIGHIIFESRRWKNAG